MTVPSKASSEGRCGVMTPHDPHTLGSLEGGIPAIRCPGVSTVDGEELSLLASIRRATQQGNAGLAYEYTQQLGEYRTRKRQGQ